MTRRSTCLNQRRPRLEPLEGRDLPSVTLGPLVGLQSPLVFIQANAVAEDPAGDTFVAGTFSGSINLNPHGQSYLTAPLGDQAGFVAKYSPSGAFLWGWYFYDTRGYLPGPGAATGLAVDSHGNPYVVGKLGSNAFIEKFDGQAGRATYWNWINGGPSQANAVAVDGAGNAYVTGSFSGRLTPGWSVPSISSVGKQDMFVAKFSPTLVPLGLTDIGGSGDTDSGNGIAVDYSGNVYVTGSVQTPAVPGLIYTAKLNPSGRLVWGGSVGGNALDRGAGVVVDGFGNVDVVGTLAGSAAFGGSVGTVSSPGTSELFVVSLNSLDGKPFWFRGIGDSSARAGGTGIALDGYWSVYVTGYMQTATNPHGVQDVLAAEFSGTGQLVTAKRYVDQGGTAGGTAIAANPAGKVAVVGYYDHKFSVDSGSFPTAIGSSIRNAFVAVGARQFFSSVASDGLVASPPVPVTVAVKPSPTEGGISTGAASLDFGHQALALSTAPMTTHAPGPARSPAQNKVQGAPGLTIAGRPRAAVLSTGSRLSRIMFERT